MNAQFKQFLSFVCYADKILHIIFSMLYILYKADRREFLFHNELNDRYIL